MSYDIDPTDVPGLRHVLAQERERTRAMTLLDRFRRKAERDANHDALTRERARAEAAEAALREVLDLFQPTAADEGWSGYLDRLGMEFYRETHVWPHFKSAPLEMHHDLADEDRQKRWTEWLTAKRDDACTRARALLGPGPSPSSGTGDAGTEGS